MRKFRGVMLLVLVVILAISGCGAKAAQSETKDSAQTQSKTSSQPATKDSTQTQDKASSQPAGQNSSQPQNNASTQPAAQNSASSQNNATAQSAAKEKTASIASTPTAPQNPIVTITMAGGDQIKLELYQAVAPNTVKNFISLVKKGFYNGLTFHRVIPGFMIQGGDPNGNGTGGPGYGIKGEFASNGFANDLKHERGVISMARTQDPNSAGSQFFIMVASAPALDGQYAAFGKAISGMEAVDKIVNSSRDQMDKPLQSQVIKSVTVDTFGVNYGEPEIVNK